MEQESFKQECHRQLLEHFHLVKKRKVDDVMKHRIQGFINAGEFLNLVTREQTIQIVDIAHLAVFGNTKEKRKANKDVIKSLISGDNNSAFDVPAIHRKTFTNF